MVTNEQLLDRRRTLLRRVAHCWGLTPGIAAPHRDVTLTTADGVRLSASYLEGQGPAVVLAPGFAGHRTKPAYALLAERLARWVSVLTVDLRGHGASRGQCTFGAAEVFDVAAAARWLRGRGHPWVGVIGASMGATAVLRAAGLARDGPLFDAVCAVSAPAVWGIDDTPAMRSINRTITVGWYRALVGALVHVRIGANHWRAAPGPRSPVELVGAIAPIPLLLVHGEDDHYFPAEQARLLYESAGEPRTLWIEPAGFGHAEDGFRRRFADRLAEAVTEVERTGRWPDR
jgi:uncharacterized protein